MKQKVNGPVAAAIVIVAIIAILATAYMKFMAPPAVASQKDISSQLNSGFAKTMNAMKAKEGAAAGAPAQISGQVGAAGGTGQAPAAAGH